MRAACLCYMTDNAFPQMVMPQLLFCLVQSAGSLGDELVAIAQGHHGPFHPHLTRQSGKKTIENGLYVPTMNDSVAQFPNDLKFLGKLTGIHACALHFL